VRGGRHALLLLARRRWRRPSPAARPRHVHDASPRRLDAYEDELHAPGSLYLIGKAADGDGGFASCCVQLKGCERNVYVLPRETDADGAPVSFVDVFNEVSALCRKHKIAKFKCKRVERQYAFEEPGVPATSAYLKLVYSGEYPALPADAVGETFSRVFGARGRPPHTPPSSTTTTRPRARCG